MKLKDFIDQSGIPITKFAYRCDLSFHKVYSILQGGSPTLRTAIAIKIYTQGKVTPEDLIPDDILENMKKEIEKNRG